jgi:hypothetical protein
MNIYYYYYWWGGTESLGIYWSLVLRPLWPVVQTPMIDGDDFWSNWWNENWQVKAKYSEKTYPSATLSTTKSHKICSIEILHYWNIDGTFVVLHMKFS